MTSSIFFRGPERAKKRDFLPSLKRSIFEAYQVVLLPESSIIKNQRCLHSFSLSLSFCVFVCVCDGMRAQCTCETRFGVVVVPAAEATAEKLIFHSFYANPYM